MNEFERDNEWQREIRDRLLAPFYKDYAREGRYVFLDKGRMATLLQKRYAVDTVLQSRKDGSALCIEEKIVRWPKRGVAHTAFALETMSCTKPGYESAGWMFYGEADYLLYCFETATGSLDCYLIDFPRLQEWFMPREASFPQFGPLETFNASKGRVVNIKAVSDNVPTWKFSIHQADDDRIDVSRIKRLVCQEFGLLKVDLESDRRQKYIARPRMIAMALARELTTLSLNQIGRLFGNRDHSTVLRACQKVRPYVEVAAQALPANAPPEQWVRKISEAAE